MPERDAAAPRTAVDRGRAGAADDPTDPTEARHPTRPDGGPTEAGVPVGTAADGRRWRRTAPASRLWRRVVGVVALFGIAAVGVPAAVAVGGGGAEVPDTATLARNESARVAAAERADRGVRAAPPTAAPTPTTAVPTPTVTPSATPTTAPTRRKTATATRTTSAPPPRPAWVHPMPGATVTSCYGMRWGVLHAGIDLAMPAGTPIRAAGAGTVVEAGWVFDGYGISVVIDHGNGYLTHYAHQSETVVSVGQRVTAGQVIGYEGATGDATGPHLHFEVHQGMWNQLDPAPWMRERGVDLGC